MIEMKTCSVDSLAKSLGSLAGIAQKRMSDEQNRLSTTIDVDSEGEPRYVNWECRLPSGDGRDRELSLLKIPWESFYTNDPLSITEISVEFDCTIKKKSSAGSVEQYLLKPKNQIAGKRDSGKPKRGEHRFKIMLTRENDFTAETYLDDQPLEDFLDQEASAEEERRSSQGFFGKIANRIHSFIKRYILRS